MSRLPSLPRLPLGALVLGTLLPGLVMAGPVPADSPLPPQRQLLTALRPTALLVREGLVVVSDEGHKLHRVSLDGLQPAASSWSPAIYPRRILDAGGGEVFIADQRSDNIHRISLHDTGEPIASYQQVLTLARDATHVYWINLGAPSVRRIRVKLADGQPVPPQSSRSQLEAVLALPHNLTDLAVEDGEVFLTDATERSVLRVRSGSPPNTVATLPAPPTVLQLTPEAIFVGAQDGAVYRIARASGQLVLLGRLRSPVTALGVAGCFVLAGGDKELVALEATRGIAIPLAKAGLVSAVQAQSGQVIFADYTRSAVYGLTLPQCPPPGLAGAARPVPPTPPPLPEKVQEAPDNDVLAGHANTSVHTIQVRLATSDDALAKGIIRSQVQKVLADPAGEVWAVATDAQIAALLRAGFLASYRDGVDRVRCTDVRLQPAVARRPPLAPFHDAGAPRAYLLQLRVPSYAVPELTETLTSHQVTLLDSESPATLLVLAGPSAAAWLARQSFASWMAPYGVRERLMSVGAGASPDLEADAPCTSPDAHLRALVGWINQKPKAREQFSAILFAPSPSFLALVRSVGGRVLPGGESELFQIIIPRAALPVIAAHRDLRVLEPYSEPSLS